VTVWPTGTTRVAAVIGHPVRHSLSPILFNAAFRAVDLDWAYVALDVAPADGEAAVRSVRSLGLGGMSVTMPHKQAAARACDRLTPVAAVLGAVNCVVPEGDELVGDSTDGAGFVAALRSAGHDPAGLRCVVVGAGGAARAIAYALGEAAAASVHVVARRAEAATSAAALAGPAGAVGRSEDIAAADLLCNATPVGMAGGASAGDVPVDPSTLHPGQVVVDIVYHPLDTPLLAAARAAGAVPVTGLGMLVHQAAVAFERWTGVPAPLPQMLEAGEGALNLTKRGR
jgi:shikimate dehydrogenase